MALDHLSPVARLHDLGNVSEAKRLTRAEASQSEVMLRNERERGVKNVTWSPEMSGGIMAQRITFTLNP